MDKETKKDPQKVRKIMKVSQYYTRPTLSMESEIDRLEVKKEVLRAKNKSARVVKVRDIEKLKSRLVIRYDSGDLIVITKAKQLVGYIMTITAKSPKKFRWSLVGKLQNNAIDALEALFKANAVKNSGESRSIRSSLQLEAYGKLKLVGYFAFISQENQCITNKQFEHISLLLSDTITLLFAWRKSES